MAVVQQQEMTPDQRHVINSGSWGAAAFSFVYLLFMRLYVPAALLILLNVGGFVVLRPGWGGGGTRFMPTLINIASALIWIYFIFTAKRLAWARRTWQGYEDFLACQRKWDRWGKAVYLGLVIAPGLIILAYWLWMVFIVA